MFRITIDSYDGYDLAAIRPDSECNITDAEWDAMNVNRLSSKATALMSGWIEVK